MMFLRVFIIALSATLMPVAGSAGPVVVTKAQRFIELVRGKTLRRPLIRLQVSADGTISGVGAFQKVSGNWTWKDGYFCRSLCWGGSDLPYNCQQVSINGDSLRFTSDRGTGKSAAFRLISQSD
jgi:hypothetical protein